MTVRSSSGRSTMLISATGAMLMVLWLALTLPGVAAGAPPTGPELRAAAGANDLQAGVQRAPIGLRDEHVVGRAGELSGWLDPAIFTDLSPISIAEFPVRLPAEQDDEPDR